MADFVDVKNVETNENDNIIELKDHNNEVVLRFTVLAHNYARVEALNKGQVIGTQYVNPMEISEQISKALKSGDTFINMKTIEIQ